MLLDDGDAQAPHVGLCALSKSARRCPPTLPLTDLRYKGKAPPITPGRAKGH